MKNKIFYGVVNTSDREDNYLIKCKAPDKSYAHRLFYEAGFDMRYVFINIDAKKHGWNGYLESAEEI